MCRKIFWKGIIVFGLTFGFSVFVSGLFIPTGCTADTKQFEVKQPSQVFEPQELKKDVPPKPLCKKYADDFIEELVRLRKEKLEFNEALQSETLSQKHKETYLQKLKRKIEEYEKKLNERNSLPRESKLLHNLVYVEKCVEY